MTIAEEGNRALKARNADPEMMLNEIIQYCRDHSTALGAIEERVSELERDRGICNLLGVKYASLSHADTTRLGYYAMLEIKVQENMPAMPHD